MQNISNQDLQYVVSILHDFLVVTDESTKEIRERRRRVKLLIKKLEKKV